MVATGGSSHAREGRPGGKSPTPALATRRLVESWLAKHGARIERAIELGCPEAVKALVASGVGLSAISVHGLREPRARLARLKVAGMRLRRPIYLARHKGKHVSPVMEAFLRDAKPALTGD